MTSSSNRFTLWPSGCVTTSPAGERRHEHRSCCMTEILNPPKVRITDSTLRDGSHAMSHQFTEGQVRGIVSALDSAGVQVIEVSHGDGLGGSRFNYGFSGTDEFTLISAAVREATHARIAVLLLPGVGTIHDLKHAHDCGVQVARIATHC